MKKDKNKMLYNNIKLANADFIKELKELNDLHDKLKEVKRDQKKIIDNFKRLTNE
tara:strand:- start:109 stop:273 length:165 start_codon:yes stop_codon:yes gene_type:complete